MCRQAETPGLPGGGGSTAVWFFICLNNRPVLQGTTEQPTDVPTERIGLVPFTVDPTTTEQTEFYNPTPSSVDSNGIIVG